MGTIVTAYDTRGSKSPRRVCQACVLSVKWFVLFAFCDKNWHKGITLCLGYAPQPNNRSFFWLLRENQYAAYTKSSRRTGCRQDTTDSAQRTVHFQCQWLKAHWKKNFRCAWERGLPSVSWKGNTWARSKMTFLRRSARRFAIFNSKWQLFPERSIACIEEYRLKNFFAQDLGMATPPCHVFLHRYIRRSGNEGNAKKVRRLSVKQAVFPA